MSLPRKPVGKLHARWLARLCLSPTLAGGLSPAWCTVAVVLAALASSHAGEPEARHAARTDHPRLYFTSGDLPRLRGLRAGGIHARIWANLTASADWCARQTPRTEWIPTVTPDPIFENLYDRFYAAMHDMAIVEHLAFASALSDRQADAYFEPARRWTLAAAKVWRNEATNKPDASKA